MVKNRLSVPLFPTFVEDRFYMDAYFIYNYLLTKDKSPQIFVDKSGHLSMDVSWSLLKKYVPCFRIGDHSDRSKDNAVVALLSRIVSNVFTHRNVVFHRKSEKSGEYEIGYVSIFTFVSAINDSERYGLRSDFTSNRVKSLAEVILS